MKNHWLSRTEMLIGEEGIARLRSSNVLVVGLGGVGAFAAEMICRAGTGKMTIVDGDDVHKSNLNRQLPALGSTIGRRKADVLAERLLDINPELDLTVIPEYIKDERMTDILDRGYDYVVDAIDTLSPKIFLIHHTVNREMRLVSSMGSGGKFDPERIRVTDISETTDCTLARILRKKLHRLGVRDGFKAVWSPEVIDKSLVRPVSGEPNKASVVGTISYMPAAFGVTIASVVIRDLLTTS
jgi:tRNA A37 threonylcarbamoyladenosine dehydratase